MTGTKKKSGVSLVEELAAVLILTITVLTVVGVIGLSRRTVLKNGTQDSAAAQAQEIADTLITQLSTAASAPDSAALESRTGARNVGNISSFAYSGGREKQFCCPASTDPGGPQGYDITVRVYYNGGKDYIQMKAFASNTGGAFNG